MAEDSKDVNKLIARFVPPSVDVLRYERRQTDEPRRECSMLRGCTSSCTCNGGGSVATSHEDVLLK